MKRCAAKKNSEHFQSVEAAQSPFLRPDTSHKHIQPSNFSNKIIPCNWPRTFYFFLVLFTPQLWWDQYLEHQTLNYFCNSKSNRCTNQCHFSNSTNIKLSWKWWPKFVSSLVLHKDSSTKTKRLEASNCPFLVCIKIFRYDALHTL